jgi:hypothetical protein
MDSTNSFITNSKIQAAEIAAVHHFGSSPSIPLGRNVALNQGHGVIEPHILTMADFVFRCPATGFNVQHELDDDQEFSEDEDEAITCLATERPESALRNFVGFAAVLADLDDLLGNDLRLTCASLIFRQIEGQPAGFCFSKWSLLPSWRPA